jgi:hypothetical protein
VVPEKENPKAEKEETGMLSWDTVPIVRFKAADKKTRDKVL